MKNAKNLFIVVQTEKTEKDNLQKEWTKKAFFTFYDKEKYYF